MNEQSIIFSSPMVRAILDGRKTQTRQVVKLPHENPLGQWEATTIGGESGGRTKDGRTVPLQGAIWHTRTGESLLCPHGQPGDRLWVRETWAQPTTLDPGPTFYRADYPANVLGKYENLPAAEAITWKPSIHMPRALSRITLEITGVRVERLQDISEEDAMAEGIEPFVTDDPDLQGMWRDYYEDGMAAGNPFGSFMSLWESINAARGFGWDVNPWVWVVEFRRLDA